MNKYKVDLTSVIVKPLYMGLLMNLLTPVVVLGVADYLDETGGSELPIQETRLNLLGADGGGDRGWRRRIFSEAKTFFQAVDSVPREFRR